ncbi:MAG: MBL fold metallo-hydrolase [Clostridiales bacterium]|nr:MBL fold metallo-hydrolase [Clostridiales bacterium]
MCIWLLMMSVFMLTGCSPSHSSGETKTAAVETTSEAAEQTKENARPEETGKAVSEGEELSWEECQENARLKIHILDVGQGNSILVESGDQAMLIDGGPADTSSYVVSYLKQRGIDDLDYAVVSHYDADHISGMVGVLRTCDVDVLLNPDYEEDTKIYSSYIDAKEDNGCEVEIPEIGDVYELGEAEFTIVAPVSYDHRDVNDNSIGVRIVCGESEFLILGDAEMESEYEILDEGMELESDVYLAGHHGSSSSSSERLLEAVDPQIVIISAGLGNSYGHPSKDTMERLEDKDFTLYRTDMQGTICACTDGKIITFREEPCNDWSPGEVLEDQDNEEPQVEVNKDGLDEGGTSETAGISEMNYIGNINSKKYHLPSCSSLPKEENQIRFYSKKEAEKAGYEPCQRCQP